MGIIIRNKQVYGNNPSVVTMGIGGGFAPIGTIISYMGTTAPQDYLICDGTEYNIDEYPQLADFFESQFGTKNKFGGDGTVTFAVPDLRGEFLRGTGTNSHDENGNGANVGVHQNATQVPYIGANTSTSYTLYTQSEGQSPNSTSGMIPRYTDKNITGSSTSGNGLEIEPNSLKTKWSGALNATNYTTRPTNTSILWCIKAVIEGMDNYSTNEKQIGYWIDGSPLYQKTVDIGAMPNATFKEVDLFPVFNTQQIIEATVVSIRAEDHAIQTLPYTGADSSQNLTMGYFISSSDNVSGSTIIHIWTTSDRTNCNGYVTIKYIKTV